MLSSLLLAVALQAGAASDFKTAFPAATTVESPAGTRLTNAYGFEAPGLGEMPAAAARAFMAQYGAAFGIGPTEKLIVRTATASGQAGPVRFERQINDLPVFGGDVVVGVDAKNTIMMVNGSDTPAELEGRFRISQETAVRAARAAISDLETKDTPRAARGWKAAGGVLRPMWRVDIVASRPAGDWRCYVDGDTGKVLSRVNRRMSGQSAVAPKRPVLKLGSPRTPNRLKCTDFQ